MTREGKHHSEAQTRVLAKLGQSQSPHQQSWTSTTAMTHTLPSGTVSTKDWRSVPQENRMWKGWVDR